MVIQKMQIRPHERKQSIQLMCVGLQCGSAAYLGGVCLLSGQEVAALLVHRHRQAGTPLLLVASQRRVRAREPVEGGLNVADRTTGPRLSRCVCAGHASVTSIRIYAYSCLLLYNIYFIS